MKFVVNNSEFNLQVFYQTNVLNLKSRGFVKSIPCRSTTVVLSQPESKFECRGTAYCSPKDTFSKKEGRRQAAIKLLSSPEIKNLFNKETRHRLFMAICPQFEKVDSSN